MTRRFRTLAILITSTAATAYGLSRLIDQLQENPSIESDLTKNKDNNSYISIDLNDDIVTRIYHQASQYLKQIHSTNSHIREYGLSRLATLGNLPLSYYTIIGQQLDYQSAIKLARTYEANSNLFPIGPPYIFPIRNKKILATGNVENVDDDDVLLHTIRQFLGELIDEKKRPLDILSQYYLKLVRKSE